MHANFFIWYGPRQANKFWERVSRLRQAHVRTLKLYTHSPKCQVRLHADLRNCISTAIKVFKSKSKETLLLPQEDHVKLVKQYPSYPSNYQNLTLMEKGWPRSGNLTFSRCLWVGNLTPASREMSNSPGSAYLNAPPPTLWLNSDRCIIQVYKTTQNACYAVLFW